MKWNKTISIAVVGVMFHSSFYPEQIYKWLFNIKWIPNSFFILFKKEYCTTVSVCYAIHLLFDKREETTDLSDFQWAYLTISLCSLHSLLLPLLLRLLHVLCRWYVHCGQCVCVCLLRDNSGHNSVWLVLNF